MTIKEAVLYYSAYPKLAATDREETTREFLSQSSESELIVVDLSEEDIEREGFADAYEGSLFYDVSATIYLHGIDSGDKTSPSSAKIAAFLKILKASQATFYLVIGQTKGKILKPITEVLTEDPYRYGPDTNPATWFANYLDQAHITVKKEDLDQFAQYAGDSEEIFVDVAYALTHSGTRGRITYAKDIFPHIQEIGATKIWLLTKYITEGDRDMALSVLSRLHFNGSHALGIVAYLLKRYRSYASIIGIKNASRAATILGVEESKTFMVKQTISQCSVLGVSRITAALSLLVEAQSELKGGSTDDYDVLTMLCLRLTDQFRAAKKMG